MNDGQPHCVTGDMATIMAGLACGEPNIISWPIIRDNTSCFISADDCLAAKGMRISAAPRQALIRLLFPASPELLA